MNRHLLLLLLGIIISLSVSAQQYRYTNVIFPLPPTIQSNVVYDQAPFLDAPFTREPRTTMGDLVMDIYFPTGDTSTRRAVVICAHGGGFVTGDRFHDDMVEFCDSLARRGYVTATIDYRQGANVLSFQNTPMHYKRAVYRGVQDGRSAVRYFRANATALGIDPDEIYILGSSAGALVGLNALYFDQASEKPVECGSFNYLIGFWPFQSVETAPDLGDIDRGANLGVSGVPNAVVSLWGAVEDTAVIQAGGTSDRPVFLVHGTADVIVPYETGTPFGVPFFPAVQGSAPINTRLNNLNYTRKETYIVPGEGHEFYGVSNGNWLLPTDRNAYWDTVVSKSIDFLWREVHKPTADFLPVVSGLNVTFTNGSVDDLEWHWDFGDGTTSTAANPSHSYAVAGTYQVQLYVEDEIDSWDTISYFVTVTNNNLLPINLLAWEAERADAFAVDLNWQTSAEVNHLGFVIERKLGEYGDWEELDVIGGANNADLVNYYSYQDNNSFAGTSYYRLKLLANDGSEDYTAIRAVSGKAQDNVINIYPNPVQDVLQLDCQLQQAESARITILNTSGQILVQQQVQLVPYQTHAIAATNQLHAGLYCLLLEFSDGTQKRLQFIKQ